MSTDPEIDELLFGPSAPKISLNINAVKNVQQQQQQQAANPPALTSTTAADDHEGGIHFSQNDFDEDELDFLLGNNNNNNNNNQSNSNNNNNNQNNNNHQSSNTTNNASNQSATSSSNASTTANYNNSTATTAATNTPVKPLHQQEQQQQPQTAPPPNPNFPQEEKNNSSSEGNKIPPQDGEKNNTTDEISASPATTTPEPIVPPTMKEQILFSIIYAIAPVTLLIVLLVLGYKNNVQGGACEMWFGGKCQGLSIGSGGWADASVFSSDNPQDNIGCADPSQACVTTKFSMKELYSDANYARCWNAPEDFFRMDSMTTTATATTMTTTPLTSIINASSSTTTSSTTTSTTSSTTITTTTTNNNNSTAAPSSSTSSKAGRIWIVPPISELGNPDLNLTRALDCCRFLPGGASGAAVTQIIVKAVVGALFDILLNAFTAIPIVAKILNIILFPFNYVYMKVEMLIWKQKAKQLASATLKQQQQQQATTESSLISPTLDAALLSSDAGSIPNASFTIGDGHAAATASASSSSAPPVNPLVSNEQQQQQQQQQRRRRRERGMTVSQKAQQQVDEFSRMVEEYTENAAKEQEEMMEALNLHCWVDEVCFPSTLMIIKSVCLSVFGVYIAASEIMKPEYAEMSAWRKYNAYAANIINGDVFSSWLDISVQFFTFFSTQTDIFRRGVKFAALAPTIGMSMYVKFMFAPDPTHPAYKFFQFCSAARNGTLVIWIMYIAPYVTHICMSFFYYLPQIVVYYLTMVQAGGLLCVIIVKVFDVYGDNWREEVMRLHKIEKEEEKEKRRKKQEKKAARDRQESGMTDENDEIALQIVSASNNKNSTTSENNTDELSSSKNSTPLISSSALFWGQLRSFFGRYLIMVMYSALVFYVYSLLCNWAVLLYDDYDRYGGASNYILVVWEELSMRQMGCQLLQLQDAIAKGDRVTYVDMFLGFF